MKQSLVFTLGLLFSINATATTYFNVEQFRLAAWFSGTMIDTQNLLLDSNPENCVNGGRYFVIANNPSNTNADYMLALLLEARANNQPLSIGVNGCQDGDLELSL